jgi:hypothetical protein
LFSEADFDADLRVVIERWPALSAEMRKAILKLVE